MLRLKNEKYDVVMLDEPLYSLVSVDNTRAYDREYSFAGEDSHPSSKHCISVSSADGQSYSCILLAGGGPSGVHEHSALIHEDRCVVAVGCYMCALSLPALELEWHTRTDWATCFGVYHAPKHRCYISHGELEIARVSYAGEIVWSVGGKDIFTNGFTVLTDEIEAVDFNDERCRIEIETGLCRLREV